MSKDHPNLYIQSSGYSNILYQNTTISKKHNQHSADEHRACNFFTTSFHDANGMNYIYLYNLKKYGIELRERKKSESCITRTEDNWEYRNWFFFKTIENTQYRNWLFFKFKITNLWASPFCDLQKWFQTAIVVYLIWQKLVNCSKS